MTKKNKIFSVMIFFLLFSGIIYVIIISSNRSSNQIIKKIDIKGYDLLSAIDYQNYLGINHQINLKRNEIKNIREKLLKHPYIKNVNIEYHPDNKATIYLEEKNIGIILLKDNSTFLISYELDNPIDYSIIPLIKNTKALDLPIITNLKIDNDKLYNENKKTQTKNKKIIESLKILSAIDEIDIESPRRLRSSKEGIFNLETESMDMKKNLSEINFDGNNVQLIFNNLQPIVIVNEKNIVRNLISLNEILYNNEIRNSLLEAKYIDFRYDNYVFVGNNESVKI